MVNKHKHEASEKVMLKHIDKASWIELYSEGTMAKMRKKSRPAKDLR